MTTDEISSLSASALTRAYGARTLSPVEVANLLLDRIEALNPTANAFAWLDPETTVAMAQKSEERWQAGRPIGPGDGIPTSIKDLITVRGWPTLRGSRTSDPNEIAQSDGPCVARLRNAGAVFIGKTTVPEFGWKGINDSPLHGVTRNPWDKELTAGGSSGGAAVAAALDLGPWHIASDAAGSIRIPAAFCGVFGFKPTHGIVPLFPPSAFSGLGHHGPITRDVRDAATLLTIICGSDPRDATAVTPQEPDFVKKLDVGLDGVRIGYIKAISGFEIDAHITEQLDAAVTVLAELGGIVEEVALDLSGAREIIEIMWAVGCSTLVDGISKDQHHLLDPGLLAYATAGKELSAAKYRAALIERENFASRLNLFLRPHDLLAMAVVPIEPFSQGSDIPPGSGMGSWLDWTPFTYPFNLSHQPAASVPCGFTSSHLPTGLQIVGRRFADAEVLSAAYAYQQAARDD